MTPFARLLLRLRRRAVRWYELLLYGLLIAMALAVTVPAQSGDGGDGPDGCGNRQGAAQK